MWTTCGLPIAPFLDKFINLAKREGYRYLLVLIARPADKYSLFENLFRDWKSIDALTGPEIMFLFVGPGAGQTNEMAGFLGRGSDNEMLFFSPYVAVSAKPRESRQYRREKINNGYSIATLAGHVSSRQEFDAITHSHEAQIKELRRRFSLTEEELPALVLMELTQDKELTVSIPSVTSLYSLLKLLVDQIEELDELKTTFGKLNVLNSVEARMSANYLKTLAILSEANLPHDSPLTDLQRILQDPHPWDSKYKSEQLRLSTAKIKADSSSNWFYRQHRGLIQALADWLKDPVDSRLLNSRDSIDDLSSAISSKESTLLKSVIDRHTSLAASANKTMPNPDLVLVTVNEHETTAVFDAFLKATGAKGEPFSLDGRVYHDLGSIRGTRVYHAISEMGSGGLGAMQQVVDKAIRALNPGAIIAVGIAFGVSEKDQSLGDILLSKQIQLYDLQRVGREIVLRGDKPHATPRLINHFDVFSQVEWRRAKVRMGLILSGEKLIDNIDYRDMLTTLQVEAIGGEMEGSGLYVACANHKVDWIVVKAICDWADGNKDIDKSQRQKEAAKNAAEFLVESLRYTPLKRLDVGVPPRSDSASYQN